MKRMLFLSVALAAIITAGSSSAADLAALYKTPVPVAHRSVLFGPAAISVLKVVAAFK